MSDSDSSCGSSWCMRSARGTITPTTDPDEEEGGIIEVFEAVKKGDVRYLDKFLRGNKNVAHMKDQTKHNLLHTAVKAHQHGCVSLLMQMTPHLSFMKNHRADTPLDLAVRMECIMEIVETLAACISSYKIEPCVLFLAVKRSFNPNERVKNYYFDLLQCLLNHGANVNIGEEEQWTLIMEAIVIQNLQIVQLLAHYGANPFTEDSHGANAFSHAARRGNLPILSFLLDQYPKGLESLDQKGNSLLLLASSAGNTDCVKFLLASGANHSQPNKQHDTPLLVAAKNVDGSDIVKILLESGANSNAVNKSNNTPLLNAVLAGSFKSVSLLLHAKADVQVKDANNATPLMIAAQQGNYRVVRVLLLYGAKVMQKDMQEQTALDLACQGEHLPVVGALLQHEVYHKQCFTFKPTPGVMYWAITKEYSAEVLKIILNSQLSSKDLCYIDNLKGINIFDSVKLNPLGIFLNSDNNIEDLLMKDKIINVLLKEKKCINPENGAIPILTVLISRLPEDNDLSMKSREIEMIQYLIKKGAKVNARSSFMRIGLSDSHFRHIERMRELLQVPDALWLAYYKKSRTVVQLLMSYWASPPVCLLTLDTECNSQDFGWWYRTLSVYGLPHGTKIYSYVEQHFNKFAEDIQNTTWNKFELDKKTPLSLKQAARFAVRRLLVERRPQVNLHRQVRVLNIPGTLKRYLLLHEA